MEPIVGTADMVGELDAELGLELGTGDMVGDSEISTFARQTSASAIGPPQFTWQFPWLASVKHPSDVSGSIPNLESSALHPREISVVSMKLLLNTGGCPPFPSNPTKVFEFPVKHAWFMEI